MAQSPERSFPEKVVRAHALAKKAHTDGASPMARLGGAVAVGAIGVAGEHMVQVVRPAFLEKFKIQEPKLHPLLNELLNDGLTAVVYSIAKNRFDALPKLRLGHFATSTAGTMLVYGAERLRGTLAMRKSKKAGAQQAAPAPDGAAAPEKKKGTLDYINPVTTLAVDEALQAVRTFWEAYQAVSAGTEEAFVKAHEPKSVSS